MNRMWLYSIAIAVIAVITFAFVVFANDTNQKNIEFLSSYGWIVDKNPLEQESITLPTTPDDVYNAYNRLQKEAGLDLTAYYGKACVRYTYKVLNYPTPINETVRANILTVDGIAVAGDIMTVSANGFMHSLNFPISSDTQADSDIHRLV